MGLCPGDIFREGWGEVCYVHTPTFNVNCQIVTHNDVYITVVPGQW